MVAGRGAESWLSTASILPYRRDVERIQRIQCDRRQSRHDVPVSRLSRFRCRWGMAYFPGFVRRGIASSFGIFVFVLGFGTSILM